MRWAPLVLLVATVLGGCAEADPDGDPCTDGRPSGNAPLADALQGSAKAVLHRFAAAFDQTVVATDDDSVVTDRGIWTIDRDGGEIGGLEFIGRGEAWLSKGVTERALVELGFDLDDFNATSYGGESRPGSLDTRYWQMFQDWPIASVDLHQSPETDTADETTWFTAVTVQDLRDLSRARSVVSDEQAVAAANSLAACEGWHDYMLDDGDGLSQVGYDVFADSLVRTVLLYIPAGHSCGVSGGEAQVDAVDGRPLGMLHFGCA